MATETTNNQYLTSYILEMAPDHYFNPRLYVVRVVHKGKFLEFKCIPGHSNPNPKHHLVWCIASESVFDGKGIPSEQWPLDPGLLNNTGAQSTVPAGYAFLLDKKQQLVTANPQTGSASFAISKTAMDKQEDISVAISAPLSQDYTTPEPQDDLNNQSVGLFINHNGAVLLRGKGGSVTIGAEGIHVGGKLFQESSSVETGILSDNTLSDLIPSTIPTAAVAIRKLPNLGTIAMIASVGMKIIEGIDKVSSITNI